MKILKTTANMLILAGGLVSCEDKVESFLTVDETPITATAEAGSYFIAVNSNSKWLAAVEDAENVDWCTLDNSTGNGDGVITVNIAENPLYSPRSVTVKVTLESFTKSVIIDQDPTSCHCPRGLIEFGKINLKSVYENGRTIDNETGALRISRYEHFKSEETEPEAIAWDYLQARQDVYKIKMDNVKLSRVHPSLGSTIIYFSQHINNIPVYSTVFIVYINNENVVTYASNVFRNIYTYDNICSNPSVGFSDALSIIVECLNIENIIIGEPRGELVYFESKDKGLELAWQIPITWGYPPGWSFSFKFFVSASDGCIIHSENTRIY